MSGAVLLLEYVSQASSGLSVDAEAGVVKNVRVLGLLSQNGRRYLREAVAAALPLYQGRAVNTDHPARANEATGLARRIGWLENVRQEADGGLRGDLHLLLSDPMSAKVLEAARRRPQLMGLSHNARGRSRREDGREIVEAIEAVESVDLVADPASVSGLHESRNPAMWKTRREWIEQLQFSRPGAARALREVAEAGIGAPGDLGMEETVPEPPAAPEPADDAADHEAVFNQGVIDAISIILKDESLAWDDKIKKVTAYMKTAKKHSDANSGGGAPPDEGGGEPTEEGKRCGCQNLREEVQLLRARDRLRLAADMAGVRLSETVVASVRPNL